MNDLISRQAAIDEVVVWLKERLTDRKNGEPLIDRLKHLPSAESERKKGRWIDMGDFEQCSACKGTHLKEVNTVYGKAVWIKSAYCPNCGANMRE